MKDPFAARNDPPEEAPEVSRIEEPQAAEPEALPDMFLFGGPQLGKTAAQEAAIKVHLQKYARQWNECPNLPSSLEETARRLFLTPRAELRYPLLLRECPPAFNFTLRSPPKAPEGFTSWGIVDESHWIKPEEPRIPIWRDGKEIGSIPREDHQIASTAMFTVPTNWSAPYDVANQQNFVLEYNYVTEDGGWVRRMALNAGTVSQTLIERIPGWRPSSS